MSQRGFDADSNHCNTPSANPDVLQIFLFFTRTSTDIIEDMNDEQL
jgi:hypothetical protein